MGWFESLSVYMLRTYFKIQDFSMWTHSLKLAWIAWDLWSICRHWSFSETSKVSADASKLRHGALMTLQVQVTDLDFGGNWETSACHLWISYNNLGGNAAESTKHFRIPSSCSIWPCKFVAHIQVQVITVVYNTTHKTETAYCRDYQ